MNVKSRSQAVIYAVRNQLVPFSYLKITYKKMSCPLLCPSWYSTFVLCRYRTKEQQKIHPMFNFQKNINVG